MTDTDEIMQKAPAVIQRLFVSRRLKGPIQRTGAGDVQAEKHVRGIEFDADLAAAVAAELPREAKPADMPAAIRAAVAKMEEQGVGSGESGVGEEIPHPAHDTAVRRPSPEGRGETAADQVMYHRWVVANLRNHYGLAVQLGEFATLTEMVDVLALIGVPVDYEDWRAARFPGA